MSSPALASDAAGRRAAVAGWALILGAITNVAFLLEGYVGARLDYALSFVSELAAHGEPGALYFRTSDVITGILLFTGAALAYGLLPQNRALRLGMLSSMAFAALTFLDGFLPLDCVPTVDAACRAAEDAGTLGWQHQTHNVTGVLEAFFAPAATLLIALGLWQLRRRTSVPNQWESEWQLLVIVGVLYTTLSVAIAVLYLLETGPLGVLQRVQITLYAVAMFTIGLAVRNYRRRPATSAGGQH